MDKKKLIMLAGGLILLVAIILIISLISPSPQPPTPSSGVVASVVLARGEDQNKNPIGATDIFSVNDPEIHAIVTFNGLPAAQNVTYQWVDIKNNQVLKEEKRQNQAIFSGPSSSSIIKDDKLNWGVGDYEFRVLINDQLQIRKPYSVKTDIDIQQENILSSIQSIVLTTAVDLQGKPTRNTSDIFSKDDESIFASVTYQNTPVNVDFEGRWIYLGDGRLIKTYQKSIVGSGTFAFSMNAKTDSWVPVAKWVPGRYVLRVLINGEEVKEIPFTVE
ncbi:MAG: hypothetical protein PHU42_00125 [Patescibacteria group bacterium]|nr:hypothetical protein [Patescibacteria group bacterium]